MENWQLDLEYAVRYREVSAIKHVRYREVPLYIIKSLIKNNGPWSQRI